MMSCGRCDKCDIVNGIEGSWCRFTGIEVRGPELVCYDGYGRSSEVRQRHSLTKTKKQEMLTRALGKSHRRSVSIERVIGCVAFFLCDGVKRRIARELKRQSLVPGVKSRLRAVLKVSRTREPTIYDVMSAIYYKPINFPVGLSADSKKLLGLAGFIAGVLEKTPVATSRTSQKSGPLLGTATMLWKMGLGGGGDTMLLPQPTWFHECSIPDNSYTDFGISHRAMTRQWLRTLKPLCVQLNKSGYINTNTIL